MIADDIKMLDSEVFQLPWPNEIDCAWNRTKEAFTKINSIAYDLEKRAFTGDEHGELKPLTQPEIREFVRRIFTLK